VLRPLILAGLALGVAAPVAAQDGGPLEDGGAQADGATPVADAAVADSGPSSDAGQPCGMVSFIGECDADHLLYCNNGVLIDVNCVDPAESRVGGPHATCGLVDCDDPMSCWGYDCVAREGEACGVGDDDLFCDVSLGHGCLAGICAPAESCQPDGPVASCDGDLVSSCPTGAEWWLDCSEGGLAPYTCGVNAAGESDCLGTAGATCNPEQGRECAPGRDCIGGRCSGGEDAGVEDAARPDVGPAPGDDDDDDESCGCRVVPPGTGALLLICGLLLLVVRTRRRIK